MIDKDVLVRQTIANMLQKDGNFRVFGLPLKEKHTEKAVISINPDIVLLDVEHLESEGFDLFFRFKIKFPMLPVVLMSPKTKQGGKAVIKALQMGAVDFITKPRHGISLLFAGRHFSKRVVPIVKTALSASESGRSDAFKNISSCIASGYQQEFESTFSSSKKESAIQPASMMVLGGCTGGPQALFSLVPQLPSDLAIPGVVVQHLPREYTGIFAEALNERSKIKVKEAYHGAELLPGTLWIASGGQHVEIFNDGYRMKLKTHRGTKELGVRPSINVLFRSAAMQYGSGTLGIILSGHGTDGLDGATAVKLAGGTVLVQDPQTAIAPEMPLNVIRVGITNQYYSTGQLKDQIVRRASALEEEPMGDLIRFRHRSYSSQSMEFMKAKTTQN